VAATAEWEVGLAIILELFMEVQEQAEEEELVDLGQVVIPEAAALVEMLFVVVRRAAVEAGKLQHQLMRRARQEA
jgi:hypothetical protein